VDTVVEALKGADHVGSLLRVDDAVEQALDAYEQGPTRRTGKAAQGFLFGANEAHPTGTGTPEGPSFPAEQRELIGREEAKNTILDRLEGFLRSTPTATTSACACAASSSPPASASCG
jgi:hypothetical protein